MHERNSTIMNYKEWTTQRINFFIKIFGIFIFFFLLLQLSLNVNVTFKSNSNGAIQLYYSNSKEASASLAEYDTIRDELFPNGTNIKFAKVPLLTDTLRMRIYGMNDFSIQEIDVNLGNICLKKYDSKFLYNSIAECENLEISLDGEYANCKILADSGFFRLESYRYFQVRYMVLIVIFLFGLSLAVCRILMYFDDQFVDKGNEYWLLNTIAVAMFIIIELLNSSYWYIGIRYRILNSLLLVIAYNIVYICLAKKKIAVLLCNIIVVIYGITNYFVVRFRGKPILPTDLYAITTALYVASGYSFHITVGIVLSIFSAIMLWFVYYKNIYIRKQSWKTWTLHILVLILIIGGAYTSKTYQQMKTYFWDSDILYFYRNYGLVASLSKYQQALHISKPQDYSQIVSDEFINEIPKADDSKTEEKIQPTNIIMIMNESFADFKKFEDELKNIDVMPFYNSLQKNTIKGNLYVSVRGGGTCNTEFESLTGNSLIFFPSGTTPFQTYIHKKTNSIASYLDENGYSTCAIHLASALNWNRKNVYPLLGISKFYSESDFKNIEKLRGRATDEENYRRVIDLYKNKKTEKFFCFDVTIQNHGGYDRTDDLNTVVDLAQYGDYPDAEVFLSLMKKSDDALKMLVEYFEQIDEPTMIIMYGDHQPSLSTDTESWVFSSSTDEENKLNRYETPFMIWTNYDIESRYINKMSANYLSSLILQTANFELPVYNQFLLYMFKKYPVISTQGILDANDNFYTSYEEIPYDEDFNIYASLQYNNVFDKNCNQALFVNDDK